MEQDSEHARASRPLSVRMMGERYPALRQDYGSARPNGDSEREPTLPREDGGEPAAALSRDAPPQHPATGAGELRDPVFILRKIGEILFANCPLGDRSEDEVIGSSIFDWIPADQHGGIAEALAKAFDTGCAQRHELAGLQRHQDDAWYDCRITPNVRDGKVVSATLVAHDITPYKRSLRQLEDSHREIQRLLDERSADLARASQTIAEEARDRAEREQEWLRFRTLMDQAGEAIFVTDPRTERIIDINETAARWLGRPRDEVLTRRLHELRLEFPVQPPVEIELEFTETRDTRRPLMLTGCHRRKDGSAFPVEVAVARHTIGSEEYVLAVARDMKGRIAAEEELQKSQEQYRSLFEQCWDAIYLTARDGRIEEVNAAAVELFGYSREGFRDLDARKLFARPMDIKRFQVQMNTLGAVGDLEVELVSSEGERFDALLSATRRVTSDGGISGYQVIVRPLTLPASEDAETAKERHSLQAGNALPEPKPEVHLRGTVVVANGGAELAMADDALRAAGMRVLAAKSTEAALDLMRLHGESIDAAVFDADEVGAALRTTLEEVRRHGPDTRIVLITETAPVDVAEGVVDLGVQSILAKPVHPLALIQKVREP